MNWAEAWIFLLFVTAGIAACHWMYIIYSNNRDNSTAYGIAYLLTAFAAIAGFLGVLYS
jgi:bacteriorhodopsin